MPYRCKHVKVTSKKSKSKTARSSRKVSFASSKQAITRLVKSVVARQEETKYRCQIITNALDFNSVITTGDFYAALPKLVQDQGEGAIYERLGRKISVRKCYLDLDISLSPNVGVRSTALVVHVWVLQPKVFKSLAQLTDINNLANRFLITGDASQYQQFNGFAQDAMLPLNTNQFSLIKKYTFLLGKNTGTIQDAVVGGNQPLAGQSIRRQLRIPLKGPKEFLYEQDNNSPRVVYYPTNFAPVFCIGYHHQDQTVPDLVNQDIVVTSRAHIWYDDA